MKKISLILLVMYGLISGSEQRFEVFYINKVGKPPMEWKIYSHTHFSSPDSLSALRKLVFTGKHYTLDLRPVEKEIVHKTIRIYKELEKEQNLNTPISIQKNPWYVHRGKLCFVAGVCVAFIPFWYMLHLHIAEIQDQ